MYNIADFSIDATIPLSDIQKFFVGQNVFITGASGFLGKILLEKILRSCPNVNKIYVLLRPKKGKEVKERLKEIFEKELFNIVKGENPHFRDKVFAIAGDCEEPDLGLSKDDQKLILQEVTCIFHVAATVKFNEPLRKAMNINVRSVIDLLKIAHQMKQLKAFVHISTAFSNCNNKSINEEFYDLPMPKEKLFQIVETLDDELLNCLTPKLLRDWPNSYVFTKCVAESYICDETKHLPIAIVRPAIVFPTINEPISGWADSIYGPIGITIGVASGIIRCVQANKDYKSELVPADFVINSVIAAAYAIGQKQKDDHGTYIYNYVSSTSNPITWKHLRESLYELRWQYPVNKCIWYPFLFFIQNPFLYTICTFFLHRLPGYFIDLILILIGKKPLLTKGYTKIHAFQDTITYFSTQEWKFSTKNTDALFQGLSKDDQRLFNFDMTSYSWEEAISRMIKGGRAFLMKESDDNLPAARRKIYFFYIANYLLVIFLLWSLYLLFT